MEKVVIIVEAKTDDAVKSINKVDQALDRVSNSANEAATETKGLGDEVRESGAAISLLDAATGGLASRVRDAIEVYKQFRGRIVGVTAAQLKANLAFLANPYVAVGAAVVGITVAFAKYASSLTDDVVPVTESLKNMFLSLGNAQRFARLQAESYTKFISEQQITETERAIAVLQAFGEETIDLEIQNAEKRLSLLKKGEEDYEATLTELLVLRAQRAKTLGEKEAQAKEEGRQAKLKEIQEQEQFEADQRALAAQQDEFDKGFLEEEAYLAGKRAVYGELEETDPFFGYLDPNKDPELDPELQYSLALNDALIQVEKDKTEKIKAARQDLFLNLASIFGAETKLGKAFLVAKQLQVASELAEEIRKTITFSQQSAARTATAAAEAIAVGNIETAKGFARTASVGFPKNIPLLIAYAAQAAGIIGAIRQAVRGIPTAQAAFVPAQPGLPPQIVPTVPNVTPVGASGINQLRETIEGQQQQPVRAYVVSSDVTSGQALDRNIIEGATI
jgi:hypothetical protein